MNVERDQLVLWESETLHQLHPIHFAGAAVLAYNAGDEDVVLSVEESADGATWASVLFSTPTTAGNLTLTLTGLSYSVISFVSASEYVRFSLTARSTKGVYVSLVQYTPVRAQTAVSTY